MTSPWNVFAPTTRSGRKACCHPPRRVCARRAMRLLMATLLVWLGGVWTPHTVSATALVQVVVAENHGVMFCHGCKDPLLEGSYGGYYLPALSSFFSPSGFFLTSELVYGVPNRADRPLFNTDEVRGRVALLDRGEVPFALKVQHSQQAGAVGVIVIDTVSCTNPREPCFDDQFAMAADTEGVVLPSSVTVFENDRYIAWRGVRIPSVLISAADGERLKSFMALEVFDLDGETHYINDL